MVVVAMAAKVSVVVVEEVTVSVAVEPPTVVVVKEVEVEIIVEGLLVACLASKLFNLGPAIDIGRILILLEGYVQQ